MRLLLLFATTIMLVGCSTEMDGDQQARDAAGAWADAYFNCDYKEAIEYVTEDSRKWLLFAASNTTEQELELLQNAGGATVEIEDYFDEANDTMRLVTMTITNYFSPTTQLQTPTLAKEGTFKITVVKQHNQWLVRMVGLPQNEMQSRD